MLRTLLLLSALLSGLALFVVSDLGGFAFLGSTLEDILWYTGVITVLIFSITLIFLGIRTLLWPRVCRDGIKSI